MILCVSATTGIERTWVVPRFEKGGVFRVQTELVLPSGKGVNVARAVHTLGEPVCTIGFTAGRSGRSFAHMVDSEGLNGHWVWVHGETRTAVAVYDPDCETDATLISAPGPRVGEADWRRLRRRILTEARNACVVGFGGSLPPGTPLDAYTRIIAELGQRGVPAWVDCDGDALRAALLGHPAGVKVNASEAADVIGIPVTNESSALRAAEALHQQGALRVVVTLGSQGALLLDESGCWFAQSPSVDRFTSSVGSGDAFFGGLLVGLARRQPLKECLRSAVAAGTANSLMLGGGRFSPEDYHQLLAGVRVGSYHNGLMSEIEEER